MTAPKGAGGGGEVGEKEEEEEEEEVVSAGLSVVVFAKSALQLTVTKTSLSIFNALWKVREGGKEGGMNGQKCK